MSTRFASFALLCVFALTSARAADPFLKPNDVIALVGGEDMVAASEYGYLELLLQRALPQHHLKVRSLAWEGDTVFEQPRDLNYPSLEQQLDDLGATVVITQFGQMESLAGTNKLPEFSKAYENLIERVSAGGKRRVVVGGISPLDRTLKPYGGAPSPLVVNQLNAANQSFDAYRSAIGELMKGGPPVHTNNSGILMQFTRDGLHLNDTGSGDKARWLGERLTYPANYPWVESDVYGVRAPDLLAAIRAKNRLWFHYTRPQNWAFLNGDRTEQPSSRDWKDPSKRWFPEEMKEWLPLIDAKEKEIWALAAKASSESAKETKPSK